jgi:hypothetical protein
LDVFGRSIESAGAVIPADPDFHTSPWFYNSSPVHADGNTCSSAIYFDHRTHPGDSAHASAICNPNANSMRKQGLSQKAGAVPLANRGQQKRRPYGSFSLS